MINPKLLPILAAISVLIATVILLGEYLGW